MSEVLFVFFKDAIVALQHKFQAWGEEFINTLPNLIVAAIIITLFYCFSRFIINVIRRVMKKIPERVMVNRIILSTIHLFFISTGFLIALSILQWEGAVATILGGAGIIGLAVGFAFQDLISNFISGVIIAARKPFRVGDILETNEFTGTILRIDLRTTHLLTTQGQKVVIPNKEVFQNVMKNYSTGLRRVELTVGVSYKDDLAKVKIVIHEAIQAITYIKQTKEVDIFFTDFGDSSINILVTYWIPFQRQSDYFHAVSDGIQRIKEAFDKHKITIPYPTHTLEVDTDTNKRFQHLTTSIGTKRTIDFFSEEFISLVDKK